MLRHALLVGLIFVGCKKEKREGVPPAQDWGNPAAGSAQPAPAPESGAMVPTNPHGGPVNPHGGAMPPNHPDVAGGNPHGDQPAAPPMAEKTAARSLEKRADGRHVLGPFTLALPKGWSETPVTSSMRAAHFKLTPAKPGLDAEMIVYYFGVDGAGSDDDNIQRWLDQLQQSDGKPTKDVAKIEKATFAGQSAVTVSASGKFEGMAMGNTPGQKIDDAMLLAAIVKSPSGPYYFKLTGAKATVTANQQAFRSLLTSLQITK